MQLEKNDDGVLPEAEIIGLDMGEGDSCLITIGGTAYYELNIKESALIRSYRRLSAENQDKLRQKAMACVIYGVWNET